MNQRALRDFRRFASSRCRSTEHGIHAAGAKYLRGGFAWTAEYDLACRTRLVREAWPDERALAAVRDQLLDEERPSLLFAAVQAPTAAALLHAAVAAVLAFRATEPALHQALTNIIPIVGRYDDLRDRGARTVLLLRALLEPVYRPVEGAPSLDELVFMVGNATHALTHEGLLPRPASLSDARLATEITRLWVGYLGLAGGAGGSP